MVSFLLHRTLYFLIFWHAAFGAEQAFKGISGLPSLSSILEKATPPSLVRALALGDFDDFNQLFENLVINLPPQDVSTRVAGITLSLSVSNLYCQGVTVGDIGLAYTQVDTQRVSVNVDVSPFGMDCFGDYSYSYAFFRGSGQMEVYTESNSVTTGLQFVSPQGFQQEPPDRTNILSCATTLTISQMNFRGGLVARILDAAENAVGNIIEDEVEDVVCDLIRGLPPTMDNVLSILREQIDEFLQPIPPDLADPLFVESNYAIPQGSRLLDWLDSDQGFFGGLFEEGLGALNRILSEQVADPGAPSGLGRDFAANVFLRQSLLDENRALAFSFADLPAGSSFDGVIFDNQGMLSDTLITIDAIKVFGLDTLTRVRPLSALGQFTLQSDFAWDSLDIEIDLTVDVRSSSRNNPVIVNPQPANIVEQIQVSFGMDNFESVVSLFLPISLDKLEEVSFGSLLRFDSLFPCFMSVLEKLNLAGFDVSLGQLDEPVLTDFLSPGIDRVVTILVEAAFLMYEPTFIRAIPHAFQGFLRELLDQQVLDPIFEDESSACPRPEAVGPWIDFRDLLLSSRESMLLGGSGDEPYGEVGSLLFDFVRDEIEAVNENGELMVNDFLIRPLTRQQSGVEGTLRFEAELLSFEKDDILIDGLEDYLTYFFVGVSDLRLESIDTVVAPLVLLAPTDQDTILENAFTMGTGTGRSLNAMFTFALGAGGDSWSSLNDFDIGLSIDALTVLTDIGLRVNATSLLQYPLRDLTSVDCWLSTLYWGHDDTFSSSGLSIHSLDSLMTGASLDVECLSCSSQGVSILPELLDTLKTAGVLEVFSARLSSIVDAIAESSVAQNLLDRLVESASQSCPASPFVRYVTGVSDGQLQLPALSPEAVDTAVFAAGVFLWSTFILLADSQPLRGQEESNPLAAEESFSSPQGVLLVNWTDFGDSTGLGTIGDEAVKGARDFLGGSDPGIISVLDNSFDDFGVLSVNLNNVSFELDGLVFGVDALRINGLDSITVFDIINPIGDLTLNNTIKIGTVAVEVDFNVGYEVPQHFTVRVGVQDIVANIGLFAAMETEKLLSLLVGSILPTRDILSCVLSTIAEFQFPEIIVTVGAFEVPTIVGLMPDTDQAIIAAFEALTARYGTDLLDAIPAVVNGPLKDVGAAILNAFSAQSTCPEPPIGSGGAYVDFREMLAPRGGTVSEIYGDLPIILKDYLDDELLSAAPGDTLARINRRTIAPLTRDKSGVPGELLLWDTVYEQVWDSLARIGIESIRLAIDDVIVKNLDTVHADALLLGPKSTSGILVDNRLTIGTETSPLLVHLEVDLELMGDPSLSTRNVVELEVGLANLDVFASVVAKLGLDDFLTFPVEKVANINCIVGLLENPELDASGFRQGASESGLAVDELSLALASLNISAACSSPGACTSAGLSNMQNVIERMSGNGVWTVFQTRLLQLSEELLVSRSIQVFIDRLLVGATQRCLEDNTAFSLDFDPSFLRPGMPSLSSDAIESLAFVGSFALNVVLVLIAQTHSLMLLPDTDPLSEQRRFSESGQTALDFTALGDTIGPWADNAIDAARSYLGSASDDSEDLGIIAILRSLVLDDSGKLSIDVKDSAVRSGDFVLSMTSVEIEGLDTLSSFDVFERIGPQTLRNVFSWEKLRVNIDLRMVSEGVVEGRRSLAAELPLRLSLELSEIQAAISVFLAVDQEALGDIRLGQILDTKAILECLLSVVHSVAISEADVSVGTVDMVSIEGFRSSENIAAAEALGRILLEDYGNVLTSSIRPLFAQTIKSMLSNWLGFLVEKRSSSACTPLNVTDFRGYLDFRDLLLPVQDAMLFGGSGNSQYGDLFRRAVELLNEDLLELDPETGISNINGALVSDLTTERSGEPGYLTFPGDLFDQRTRVNVGGLDANVRIKIYDAYVANLDTFGAPLSILEAVMSEPLHINNTASVGVGRPLTLGSRFMIELIGGDGTVIRNDVEISIAMSSTNVVLTVLLRVIEQLFLGFPLKDVTNLDCWLATLVSPSLDDRGVRVEGSSVPFDLVRMAASIGELKMNVTCIECSSPLMPELTRILSTEDASVEATAIANDVLEYVSRLLGGNFVEVTLDRMINDSRRMCPHSQEYDPRASASVYEPFVVRDQDDALTVFIALGIVAFTLTSFILMVGFVVRLIVRRRHRRWLRTLPRHKLLVLRNEQNREAAKESHLDGTTVSMFRATRVPSFVQYFVPIAVLGNIALFLSGHLSLGGSVSIVATIGGQEYVADNFFEFSMAKSTIDIWNAGGRELAILILLFSGIWPYTKQLVSLVLWFLPPSALSVSRRGNVLMWLDALAKWSMVDIFVLILTIAGFRVSVKSPQVDILPDDFYSIDLLVIPKWGLYANMIAQLVSQITSHVILHYHKRIADEATRLFERKHRSGDAEDVSEQETRLCSHAFSRPHRGESDNLVVRSNVNTVAGVLVVALGTLLVLGCALPSFSLEVLGIVGVLVESGQRWGEAFSEYSVFTTVRMLFEQAKFTGETRDYLGLGSLSVLLIGTVVLVPLLQSGALLFHWYGRMSEERRRRATVVVEILQAWQYAEVYLLAVIVTSWQLGPVSDFMINVYCSNLEEFFAQLVYYGVLKEDDAQCFRVNSDIESGAYVLGAAAILLAFLNAFVLKASHHFLRDKHHALWSLQQGNIDGTLGDAGQETSETMALTIKPAPVLFTDSFRWILRREDTAGNSKWTAGDTALITEETAYLVEDGSPRQDLMADTRADPGEEPLEAPLRSQGKNSWIE